MISNPVASMILPTARTGQCRVLYIIPMQPETIWLTVRVFAKCKVRLGTGKMPVPQRMSFLVGWAEEPAQKRVYRPLAKASRNLRPRDLSRSSGVAIRNTKSSSQGAIR